MCPNAAAIDDGTGLINPDSKRFEDSREVTAFRPVVETIVDALPRSESFGQVTPRNPRLRSVQHRIDELPIANFRLRAVSSVRKNGPQSFPLLVAQRVSVHPDF
jgi:hypothetical protein